MDEVDPYQSQHRRTDESHEIMVVYPNDRDEITDTKNATLA
jgi:hypothetical protein